MLLVVVVIDDVLKTKATHLEVYIYSNRLYDLFTQQLVLAITVLGLSNWADCSTQIYELVPKFALLLLLPEISYPVARSSIQHIKREMKSIWHCMIFDIQASGFLQLKFSSSFDIPSACLLAGDYKLTGASDQRYLAEPYRLAPPPPEYYLHTFNKDWIMCNSNWRPGWSYSMK